MELVHGMPHSNGAGAMELVHGVPHSDGAGAMGLVHGMPHSDGAGAMEWSMGCRTLMEQGRWSGPWDAAL